MSMMRIRALLAKDFLDLSRNRLALFPVGLITVLSLVMPFGIAVAIPFFTGQDLSGDAAQTPFADSLTEEAILQLGSRNPEKLGVIARTSAMKFRNAGKSIAEISRELRTDYIVEGTVRRDPNRVRISARLISTRDQSTRWTHDFSFPAGESPTVQAQVANSIANEVEKALGHSGGPHTGAASDAYDSYLRGLAGAFILVFIPATRELSSAIFLYTTGTQVLSVLLFDKSDEGNFEILSSMGLILVVATVALVLLGFRLVGRDFMLRRTAS